jgi:hypothetical protein
VLYGISDRVSSRDVNVTFSFARMKKEIDLHFDPNSSLLVKLAPGSEPEVISYKFK